MMRQVGFAALACAGIVGAAACGPGGMTSAGSGGTTSASTASTSGSSGKTSSGGEGGAGSTTGTGGASSSGSGSMDGYCTKGCKLAEECCPTGLPNCPSTHYPTNFACVDGICQSPQCASTSDCTNINSKYDCFSLSGFHACAQACMADADCPSPTKCIGTDDAMKHFCLASSTSGGCKSITDCAGRGRCEAGSCVCSVTSECMTADANKCSNGK